MRSRSISPRYWILLVVYSVLWTLALPFLFFVKRLKPVNGQRFALGLPSGPFQVWIQAASVGEAKLAASLAHKLNNMGLTNVLVTTNTASGMEVLEKELDENTQKAYFPFDSLYIMPWALRKIRPGSLVLLETELWPGLLYLCRRKNIPVILGNGRLSLKSFCRYFPLRNLLAAVGPGEIAAVTGREAERFSSLFPDANIRVMPNIKFDLLAETKLIAYVQNPLSSYFKPKHPLIVLGSIRKEEERAIFKVIQKIVHNRPKTTIALFPRHLTRIEHWQSILSKSNIPYTLRSGLETGSAPSGVIIWDGFGELESAYALARSAFVGGSLMPCGGQNFLETLAQGTIPCVGPFWDNFSWVGREIIDAGLLIQVRDEHELYSQLIQPQSLSREQVEKKFQEYLTRYQGGTSYLANLIRQKTHR